MERQYNSLNAIGADVGTIQCRTDVTFGHNASFPPLLRETCPMAWLLQTPSPSQLQSNLTRPVPPYHTAVTRSIQTPPPPLQIAVQPTLPSRLHHLPKLIQILPHTIISYTTAQHDDRNHTRNRSRGNETRDEADQTITGNTAEEVSGQTNPNYIHTGR